MRETSMCDCLLCMRPALGTWSATQACALTGNRTRDLLVHRLALNPLSLTSQGKSLGSNAGAVSLLFVRICLIL